MEVHVPLPEVAATLDSEDLNRFTAVELRVAALERNPTAYSQAETETIIMAYRRCAKDILVRYNIDLSREWQIDVWGGVVTYKDD